MKTLNEDDVEILKHIKEKQNRRQLKSVLTSTNLQRLDQKQSMKDTPLKILRESSDSDSLTSSLTENDLEMTFNSVSSKNKSKGF